MIWCLTHWGRVTHICVSDLTSIGSDNGSAPGRRRAIIRTNAGILLIKPLGTNFSEFLVEILIFSFKKIGLKGSSAKRRPFCFSLNELRIQRISRQVHVLTWFTVYSIAYIYRVNQHTQNTTAWVLFTNRFAGPAYGIDAWISNYYIYVKH